MTNVSLDDVVIRWREAVDEGASIELDNEAAGAVLNVLSAVAHLQGTHDDLSTAALLDAVDEVLVAAERAATSPAWGRWA